MEKSIAIIGGGGRLGSWFRRFFEAEGFEVTVVEVDDGQKKEDIADKNKYILFATPHRVTPELIGQWGSLLTSDHVLVDLSSVKTFTALACSRVSAESLLIHPMWSPQVPSMKGQALVVCGTPKIGTKSASLLQIFEAAGARLSYTNPDEHDQIMSMIQVVSHASLLAIGLAHKRSQLPLDTLLHSESPVYRMISAMVGRMLSHQADLYADIATLNPYGAEGIRMLGEAVSEIELMIRNNDSEGYAKLFTSVQAHRASSIPEAVRDSAAMIEALVKHESI